MPINPSPYRGAFRILSRDFERAAEYIEFIDANYSTYSHRLYELLLRACTEFESACRDKLVESGYGKSPDDMNVNDYKTLETTLKLSTLRVGVLIWQPHPTYMDPFNNWATNQPPLAWYKAYNSVKHNRNPNFKEANLENVLKAITGLFALLTRIGVYDNGNMLGSVERAYCYNATSREELYPGEIFTVVRPGP